MKRFLLFSFLTLFTCSAMAQIVPMTNDDCATAIVINDGVNPSPPAGLSGNVFTNVGSLVALSAGPAYNCGSGAHCDVWFAYTATTTGSTIFETCTPAGFAQGSHQDTVIQILDAAACPPVTVLGCDDDACTNLPGFASQVIVPTVSGNPYFVRIASWSGSAEGTFHITVTGIPAPANDECATAIPLVTGPNGPYANIGATNSVGYAASCGVGGAIGSKDVFFSYTTGACGTFTVDTGCGGFDTVVGIYDVCGGTELACNDDNPSNLCGLSSIVSYSGLPGTTYIIRVGSWSTAATGTFNVNLGVGFPGMNLVFTSPLGPGSVQIDILDGPANGTYIWLITGNAGAFPNGWLYGLDIPPNELANEINAGFPFVGPLDLCGNFSTGPIGGVGFLSGIPLYSIAFGIDNGGVVPTQVSTAITYTIP